MQVYKFGGASLKDAQSIQKLVEILQDYPQKSQLMIVVSAMGKTTNDLEAVLNAYWKNEEVSEKIEKVKVFHQNIIQNLFPNQANELQIKINSLLAEISYGLQDTKNSSYDQLYDRIVGYGELISSQILHTFLRSQGFDLEWVDARENIISDQHFREANVDWNRSRSQMQKNLKGKLENQWLISQGFICGDGSGQSLTLGREGSDYSAALFAWGLSAEKLSIWKDVPGILNADPRRIPSPELFQALSYQESALMSKYGASVIHPKTIAPLEKAGIQLHVRSFIAPQSPGTLITATAPSKTQPCIIYKSKQVLLSFQNKTHRFIKEIDLLIIIRQVNQLGLKINYLLKKADSFVLVSDNFPLRIDKLIETLEEEYLVGKPQAVELLTILHPSDEAIQKATQDYHLISIKQESDLYQAILHKEKH